MNRLLLVLLLGPFTLVAQSTLNDLDGDGCVGATDILVILGQYGECQDTITAIACGDSVLFDSYWYATVQIGDQCWFAENLTSSTYLNGDVILQSEFGDDWTELSVGAQCFYGDNMVSLETYGRLYNWYAVTDGRGICPSGWHAPDHSEFQTLKNFVSAEFGEENVAQALKSTDWSGSDLSGFSALAAGYRVDNLTGFYDGLGGFTGFWTTSPSDDIRGWHFRIHGEFAGMNSNNGYGYGFSVRCLKDPE